MPPGPELRPSRTVMCPMSACGGTDGGCTVCTGAEQRVALHPRRRRGLHAQAGRNRQPVRHDCAPGWPRAAWRRRGPGEERARGRDRELPGRGHLALPVAQPHRCAVLPSSRSGNKQLDRTLHIQDKVFPINYDFAAEAKNQFLLADYRFSFVKTEKIELAGALGVYAGRFSYDFTASAARSAARRWSMPRRRPRCRCR